MSLPSFAKTIVLTVLNDSLIDAVLDDRPRERKPSRGA
jgi:hypothetical protein